MTLEGWVDDVVKPILFKHPYAWIFFISFIVVTTFTVLNLIIGIIVNAISEEHAENESKERKAERKIMHEETAPLMREIKSLRAEIASLRGRRLRQAPVVNRAISISIFAEALRRGRSSRSASHRSSSPACRARDRR
jgi:hypothetical protein